MVRSKFLEFKRWEPNWRGRSLAVLVSIAALMTTQNQADAAGGGVGSFVKPFIGTGGHGHTYPGASVPFGMVQLSPDTGTQGWDWCSGYHASDDTVLGFSHTHLSGTGCGDLGDVLFAPTVGKVELSPPPVPEKEQKPTEKEQKKQDKPTGKEQKPPKPPYTAHFLHKNEFASPGYYSVRLDRDGGIQVELTATERVGMHRYTFPKTQQANVIIDLSHGIEDKPVELELNVIGDREISGLRRSKGWADDQYVYFDAEFSQPFTDFGIATDDQPVQKQISHAKGKKLQGYLTFNASQGQPLVVKVGLSTTSIEGARRNLASEVPGWDFDTVRKSAELRWRKALSCISVQSSERKELETFYTALYHVMLAPTLISDVDRQYRGSDHQVHSETKFDTYSTFSLWDTFRAEHPLLTIIRPDLINALITSIIHQGAYHENKTLAIWPLYGCETYCMIGYHSFPVIAEAYRKGFRDWDAAEALDLMLRNSTRNDWWADKGYIPADKENQSVSKTVEFAYDDWALAQFAGALGKTDPCIKFLQRSLAFKNVFDSKVGFVRGHLEDGSWRTPFNPGSAASRDFTEGTAWQYTFFAPHDVPYLIAELGGRRAFVQKLDELFERPFFHEKGAPNDVSGTIGQYAHGNEPSHHIAYLYDYAGEPAKTQLRVRQIRERLYSNAADGLCGNEDCGQMSAWYVFSALGFYPVNPVNGEYVIGIPAFPRAAINLSNGKTFTIVSDPSKKFIQSVLLNGRPLSRTYITHDEIVRGGTLRFITTNRRNSRWGTSPQDAPH